MGACPDAVVLGGCVGLFWCLWKGGLWSCASEVEVCTGQHARGLLNPLYAADTTHVALLASLQMWFGAVVQAFIGVSLLQLALRDLLATVSVQALVSLQAHFFPARQAERSCLL
jgi:hypothetical protein